MVSFNHPFFNLYVKEYSRIIKRTTFFDKKCPSCHVTGSLIKHSFYTRTIIIGNIKVKIRILRLICKECGKVHQMPYYDYENLLEEVDL